VHDATLLRVHEVGDDLDALGHRTIGQLTGQGCEFVLALLPAVVHLELEVVARTVATVEEAVEQVLQSQTRLATPTDEQVVVTLGVHGHVDTVTLGARRDLGLEAHLAQQLLGDRTARRRQLVAAHRRGGRLATRTRLALTTLTTTTTLTTIAAILARPLGRGLLSDRLRLGPLGHHRRDRSGRGGHGLGRHDRGRSRGRDRRRSGRRHLGRVVVVHHVHVVITLERRRVLGRGLARRTGATATTTTTATTATTLARLLSTLGRHRGRGDRCGCGSGCGGDDRCRSGRGRLLRTTLLARPALAATTTTLLALLATAAAAALVTATTLVATTALLAAAGFFIYGPQALIGITAANLATKRAAATAAGFTGLFGYASTIVSGWGLGLLVEKAGWHTAFGALLGIGALGTFMFILAWRAPAHGYGNAHSSAV